MHSVRRGARPSEAQLEQERQRSAHAASVIRRCLAIRRVPIPNPITEPFLSSYKLFDTAVLNNPDEYTLWAFRREVLTAMITQQAAEAEVETEIPTEEKTAAAEIYTEKAIPKRADDPVEAAQQIWKNELNLTMRALRNHPKAYPAWLHRIWLLNDLPQLDQRIQPRQGVATELQLTKSMLSADARNFHGWAHRMRIRAIRNQLEGSDKGLDDKKELDFVLAKINDDFANYSAWHHRSVLLPRIHASQKQSGKPSSQRELVRKELNFVKQAFYTEPDVQSVWFYHRWLLAGAPVHGEKVAINKSVLEDELVALDELIELEPDARYAWLAKAHILVELGNQTEAFKTLDKLDELDPMRGGYYNYLRRKLNRKSTVRSNSSIR